MICSELKEYASKILKINKKCNIRMNDLHCFTIKYESQINYFSPYTPWSNANAAIIMDKKGRFKAIINTNNICFIE